MDELFKYLDKIFAAILEKAEIAAPILKEQYIVQQYIGAGAQVFLHA